MSDKLNDLQDRADALVNQLLFVTSEEAYNSIETEIKQVRKQIAVLEGIDRSQNKEAEEAALKARLQAQENRISKIELAKKARAEIEKQLFKDIGTLYKHWMNGFQVMLDISPELEEARHEARDLNLEKPEGFPVTFAFNYSVLDDIHEMVQKYAVQAGDLQSAKKAGKPVLMTEPDWETFTTWGKLMIGEDGKPMKW